MNLLHQRRLSSLEGGIATVNGADEMVAEMIAAGCQTRIGYDRNAVNQRHIGSQNICLRNQALKTHILKRHGATRYRAGSVQISDNRRERNWLPCDRTSQVRSR